MRKVTLLFAMIAFASFAFAQKGFVPQKYNLYKAQPGTELHSNANSTKAPGDVIFSEDFDGADWSATSNNGEPVPANAPAGWVLGDLSGNGFYFRWDTVGPRGIFTSPGDGCTAPADPLQSTTGANGFMMIEPDFFNSAADCSQYFEDGMDSYIEYNAGIDFSAEAAIHLVFEQANRFCCSYSGDSDAWFRVSTDNGTTWSGLKVSEGDINSGVGSITGGAAYVSEFDISNDVAGEANVIFRFHLNGLSHYHWEIDDVMFIVPEDNDIQFLDYWNDYLVYRDGTSTDYPLSNPDDFTEGFYEYPWFLVQEFKGFHAAYINFGGADQTNFVHNVEVYKDGSLLESFATEAIADLPVGGQDTTMLPATLWPWEMGEYKFVHYPSTDVTDDIPSNDTLVRHMVVGDDVIRVANFDEFDGSLSPDNWTSYDEDGDGIGFYFNLPEPSLHDQDGNPDYYILDGAYIYVAANTGAEELALFETEVAKVVAGVYRYNEADDSYTQVISSAEYTLTLNDTASVVYVPFAQDGTAEYVFQGGDFVLAFNMYGTWTDPFDRLQSWNVRSVSNAVQKNATDALALVNAAIATSDDLGTAASPEGPCLALELTYTEPYIGIGETVETLDFSVYPNPSNGTFTIDAQGTSQVTIMNAAGQVVDSKIVTGGTPISIDVVSGVYFVRVQNGNKVGTQRLIVE
ncbi:MAG: hypothetical protein C0599_06290 [Salinivirgaceae bacterium]|nr:MAG: hypothetical protein C0599_06290 [Salinivirgaceae bacterium]